MQVTQLPPGIQAEPEETYSLIIYATITMSFRPRLNHEPMLIGDVMRQLFIVRDDGTVDLDMLAAHLRAEELHPPQP